MKLFGGSGRLSWREYFGSPQTVYGFFLSEGCGGGYRFCPPRVGECQVATKRTRSFMAPETLPPCSKFKDKPQIFGSSPLQAKGRSAGGSPFRMRPTFPPPRSFSSKGNPHKRRNGTETTTRSNHRQYFLLL